MNKKITLLMIKSNNLIKSKINNTEGNTILISLVLGAIALIAIISFGPDITSFYTYIKDTTITFFKDKLAGVLK